MVILPGNLFFELQMHANATRVIEIQIRNRLKLKLVMIQTQGYLTSLVLVPEHQRTHILLQVVIQVLVRIYGYSLWISCWLTILGIWLSLLLYRQL